MRTYQYPANATIFDSATNYFEGRILAEPAVLAPCRCLIDGTLHGPEICDLLPPEELAALGIKRVVAEALPKDKTGWPYLPGEHVDTETDTEIQRSFPNATPDVEGSAANQVALANAVRIERNARIAACDWTQLADAALTPEAKAAWAAYRQELRDITKQKAFPRSVTWPAEPGA